MSIHTIRDGIVGAAYLRRRSFVHHWNGGLPRGRCGPGDGADQECHRLDSRPAGHARERRCADPIGVDRRGRPWARGAGRRHRHRRNGETRDPGSDRRAQPPRAARRRQRKQPQRHSPKPASTTSSTRPMSTSTASSQVDSPAPTSCTARPTRSAARMR